MTVLFAEHDPSFRRMLHAMLLAWGHEVIVANEAREAYGLLQNQNPPSLAILDSMLPDVDGLQLCRRIHQVVPDSLRSHVIMLLRRGGMKDVFAASLAAGADDYIARPFDPEELRARLAVCARVMRLRQKLADCERQLLEAIARIDQLESERSAHGSQGGARRES